MTRVDLPFQKVSYGYKGSRDGKQRCLEEQRTDLTYEECPKKFQLFKLKTVEANVFVVVVIIVVTLVVIVVVVLVYIGQF